MKVCRICITKDDKLYPISSNGLHSLYYQLTGVLTLPEDVDKSLPQWVCEECGLRLMSYDKLRQKSLRAHQVLSQLLKRVTCSTEDALNQIDREWNESEGPVDVTISIVNNPDNDNGNIQERERDPLEPSTTYQNLEESKNESQSNVHYDLPNNITQEDNSELDNSLQEDCQDVSEPNKLNSEQNNNGLQFNISDMAIDCDIIQENEDNSESNMLEDHFDLSIPLETTPENAPNIQELDANNGDCKLDQINEVVIVLEAEETSLDPKISNDSFIPCLSETLVSDTANDVRSENNLNADAALFNNNDNTLDLTSKKSKNKKKDLSINQVHSIDLLQKTLPQVKVKKVVVKHKAVNLKVGKPKAVKENSIVRKEFGKQKTVSQKVDKIKVVKRNQGLIPINEFISLRRLSFLMQMAEFEQRKYERNYTDSPYKCNVCYTGFVTEVTFARHQLLHSDEYGKIECNICKRRFFTKGSCKKHMDSHENVFSCNACSFEGRHRRSADLHTLKHKGKVYKCPDCDKEFKDVSSYTYHRRIDHVTKIACNYCGFSFVSDSGLNQHIFKKHRLERKIPFNDDSPNCAKCTIRFVSDEALNTHLQVSHPKKSDVKIVRNIDENYKKSKTGIVCDICGVKTSDGKEYYKHFKLEHPTPNTHRPNPFVCEQCGKVFKRNFHYKRHLIVHSDSEPQKPYSCDECGKKFGVKSSIRTHILTQHLPKKSKPKNYICSTCGKRFLIASHRDRHVASAHLGLKERFPCTKCGNFYSHAGALKRHMMIVHLGQRSFICDTCGKSYTAKHKMREHIEHIHMNVARPAREGARRTNRRGGNKSV